MPGASREGTILVAAKDLTTALLQISDSDLLPPVAKQTRRHLLVLANLFHKALKPTQVETVNVSNMNKPRLLLPPALPKAHPQLPSMPVTSPLPKVQLPKPLPSVQPPVRLPRVQLQLPEAHLSVPKVPPLPKVQPLVPLSRVHPELPEAHLSVPKEPP